MRRWQSKEEESRGGEGGRAEEKVAEQSRGEGGRAEQSTNWLGFLLILSLLSALLRSTQF